MSNWIEDYVEYTRAQESPTLFHRWGAITAIAAAVSRKVVLPRTNRFGVEFFRTWPGQISVVLVAGAGRCKKSIAVNLIAGLLKETGLVNVFEGKITPEQLLYKMSLLPSERLTIIAEELSAFLTKVSYNDGLIDHLNGLLDGVAKSYESRGQAKGKSITLRAPSLTMLCATTPTNLAKAILPQAIGHGYASRQIYVYSEEPGEPEPLFYFKKADPATAAYYESLRTSLIVRLKGFCELSGEFQLDAASEHWYQQWYLDYKNSGISDGEGWPQRLPEHLVRVAMVLAISRGGELRFETKDLDQALYLLLSVHANMDKVFAHVGQHANSDRQERLIKVFQEKAIRMGVHYAIVTADELFKAAIRWYPSSRDLEADLQFMESAGSVYRVGTDAKTGKASYALVKEAL